MATSAQCITTQPLRNAISRGQSRSKEGGVGVGGWGGRHYSMPRHLRRNTANTQETIATISYMKQLPISRMGVGEGSSLAKRKYRGLRAVSKHWNSPRELATNAKVPPGCHWTLDMGDWRRRERRRREEKEGRREEEEGHCQAIMYEVICLKQNGSTIYI